jgi:hypothetical protein
MYDRLRKLRAAAQVNLGVRQQVKDFMKDQKNCPECNGTNLYSQGDISVRGGYGPDLLPGAGSLFNSPKVRAVVCADCGLIRYFASQDALRKMAGSDKWKRLL